MKQLLTTLLILFILNSPGNLAAQNVGIGTNSPQSKLHVAGDVRIDDLADPFGTGLVFTNGNGNLSRLTLSNNNTDVLKGNGTWGTLTGLVPASGIVASPVYNNTALLNAGYTLYGELPGVSSYTTTSSTFAANTWQPTYTRGIVTNISAPEFNFNDGEPPMAIYNGSLVYVPTATKMYTYDPINDTWAIVSNQGFTNFLGTRAVWTGTEIIFWSGLTGNGSRYNPSTGVWNILPVANSPSARYDYTMIWDGTHAVVWGGSNSSGTGVLNTGALYDPATNLWTATNTTNAPSARQRHTAVWNTANNRMIIWGGSLTSFSGEVNTGSLFDPSTNTWTGATSVSGAVPSARNSHTAIWTGTEMIVFGGVLNSTVLNTGARYNPITDSWSATNTAGAPLVVNHAAVYTGSAMFISGGTQSVISSSSAYSYNPSTNSWTSNGTFNASDGKQLHRSFFTGNMVLIWAGVNKTNNFSSFNWSNTGYRYFLTSTASSATTLSSQTLYLYLKN